jgi:hypothetical protein
LTVVNVLRERENLQSAATASGLDTRLRTPAAIDGHGCAAAARSCADEGKPGVTMSASFQLCNLS